MAASPNERLRIKLELDAARRNDGGVCAAVVWNPSNKLHGSLEIDSVTTLEVVEATVFLEGFSRNWIRQAVGNGMEVRIAFAERRFLSQTMDVPPSLTGVAMAVPGGFRLVIPFEFVISETVSNPNPGAPLQCLNLPPSIELGDVHIDRSSGKRYAQPSISYQIRAIVNLIEQGEEQGQEHTRNVEVSSAIIIMPYTEELPPTDSKDFPAEFKLQESRPIRWSSLGRTYGTMTVSTQEPRALVYDASSKGAYTVGLLDLELESTDRDNVYQILKAMSFKLLSLIRVKTFYSVKAFPELPSQSLLTLNGGKRLRDDIIKLETRDISRVSWGYTYDKLGHAVSDSTISSKRPSREMPAQIDGESLETPYKSILQPPKGKWVAKISHPVSINSRLLPTFCSSIVSCQYSIILRLKVSGIKKEIFDLEVPLQVVHTAPSTTPTEAMQDAEASTGVIGEDPSSLLPRRPSLASWFSDESLENEEPPPRYHP